MTPLRRRGVLLLCFALVCGGLAASQVRERERRASAALGPLVALAVASRDLPADHRLAAGDLAARRVPARYAPPDAFADPEQLAGARTAVPLAAGAFLTAAVLGGRANGSDQGLALRPGQRAVSVRVSGALGDARPGSRVDIVVSTQPATGGGRTFVALEDVLAARPAGRGRHAARDGAAGRLPHRGRELRPRDPPARTAAGRSPPNRQRRRGRRRPIARLWALLTRNMLATRAQAPRRSRPGRPSRA